MQRKLPLWLTHFPPGEPAHGVLLRIAELNGLAPAEAIEMIGGDPSWIFSVRTTDAILREVGEEFTDLVQKSTPRFEGLRYVHVNGERLSSKLHWVRGVRRRCPLCLGNSPHHRVWWDSSAITACSIHAVELEDRCLVVGCDCQIKWTSGSISRCENNHDLTGSCRSVQASELSAEAYIAGRLGLPRCHPVPFLDRAHLDDAIELMDKVGRAAIGGNLPAMPTLSSLGLTKRATFLKGFQILARGELGIEELVSSITRNNTDHSISRSLTPRYGWLHHWLRKGPRSWVHSRLLELMIHHAKGHVPTAAPDDPFVAILSAAKQLNIHPMRLRRILKALGLIRAERRQGVLLGIRREHVEKVRSILQEGTSLKEAAIRIGESQRALIRLMQGGLLPTAFRAGTEGLNAHILKKADIDELIAHLNQGVPQVTVPPSDSMSLASVVRATCIPHVEIISLVLATRLRPAARLVGAPPISGLYFHYGEVRAAYLSGTRTALTFEEAAKEIGVNSKGFGDLLRGEYIKRETRVTRRGSAVISRLELDRFKSKYATASEFSEILATSATRAYTRLVQLGLQPAIKQDKCRKLFFYRKEVEALFSRLTTIPTNEEVRASFWLGLYNECQRVKSSLCIPARHGGPKSIEFASGIPHVKLLIFFSFTTSTIRVGLCFRKGAQQALRLFLKAEAHRIWRDIGLQSGPIPLPRKTKSPHQLILADCPRGKLFDRTTWPEIYDWVLEILPKLLQAMQSRLKGSLIVEKRLRG
jgi:hypothetical protein